MPIISIDGVEHTITQAQLDAEQPPHVVTEGEVRGERDRFLSETDWWALSDRTMTAEQTAYRQALRDITSQAGFPTNITWPQEPSA